MDGRRARVEEVFEAVMEAPEPERRALLEARCGGDGALRAEVESLLAAADSGGASFLERPAIEREGGAWALGPGGAFGRYTIERVLGEGGMGVVYEARQDHPSRTVALKVIRPELVSREALRRFEFEAEVLGQLQHPGIAHVYDAGSFTPAPGMAARPFIAMELVRGESLVAYAGGCGLPVRDRVELLARVCDAVHHAHARGIVHRDLKPGNVLVDESGRPKVLDFGIARAAGNPATMQTAPGQIIGTLGYMSPEQLEGDSRSVDTRADVYALGAMLYELLAGRPPLDLGEKSIGEIVRMVRHTDPPRLGSLRPELRGDFETIAATALAKDKEARYGSAAELAADLRRALRNEPIVAHPPSAMYQLRKFARRNRPLVIAGVAGAGALVAGAGVATWQAIVASAQRDAARAAESREGRARARAEAVRDFLVDDVFGATNFERMGPNVPAVELLKAAGNRAEERFGRDPAVHQEVEALLAKLGDTAGDDEWAVGHSERAAALARAVHGEDSLEALNADLDLLHLVASLTNPDRVMAEAPPLVERASRIAGPGSIEVLRAELLRAQGFLQLNTPREAKAILVPLIERNASGPHAHSPHFGHAMNLLAAAHRSAQELDEAIEVTRRWLAFEAAHGRPDSPTYITALLTQGQLLGMTKRFEECEPILREALDRSRTVYAPDDTGIAFAEQLLGACLSRTGKYEESEALVLDAVRIFTLRFGDDHWDTLICRRKLPVLYRLWGREDKREAWILGEEALLRRIKPDGHDPMIIETRRLMADLEVDRGRYDEASAILGEIRPVAQTWADGEHRIFWEAVCFTSSRLDARLGRRDEARAGLERARDYFKDRPWQLAPFIVKDAAAELEELESGGANGG